MDRLNDLLHGIAAEGDRSPVSQFVPASVNRDLRQTPCAYRGSERPMRRASGHPV